MVTCSCHWQAQLLFLFKLKLLELFQKIDNEPFDIEEKKIHNDSYFTIDLIKNKMAKSKSMEPKKFTINPFAQNVSITQESNQKPPTH